MKKYLKYFLGVAAVITLASNVHLHYSKAMEDKTPYSLVGEYDTTQLNHTLESLNEIGNFGVYANTVSYTNHLEAYVAAGEVAEGTLLDIVPQRSNVTDGYCIVLKGGIVNLKPSYESPYATVVITDATYFSGDAQKNGKPNTWIQAIPASEENKLTKIDTNLKVLALESNTLIKPENIVPVNDIYDYLAKSHFVCLTISADDLVNNNKVNNIINVMTADNIVLVNVVTNDIDVVNINQEVRCEAFNAKCGNLYWNFGSFDGEININTHFAGTIVAPAALVRVNAGNLDGSVISNIFGNNAEVHQVRKKIVKINEQEETTTSIEETTTTQKVEPTTTTVVPTTTVSATKKTKEQVTTTTAALTTSTTPTATVQSEKKTKEQVTTTKEVATTVKAEVTTTAKEIVTTKKEVTTTVKVEPTTAQQVTTTAKEIVTKPTKVESASTVVTTTKAEELTTVDTNKVTKTPVVAADLDDVPQTGDDSSLEFFAGLFMFIILLLAADYIYTNSKK